MIRQNLHADLSRRLAEPRQLWEADTHAGVLLKVLLLGSAPLLMQTGLTESRAGRCEIIPVRHWSFAEMREAFAPLRNSRPATRGADIPMILERPEVIFEETQEAQRDAGRKTGKPPAPPCIQYMALAPCRMRRRAPSADIPLRRDSHEQV